jgi:bacterial surface protein 26-residue repeat
MFQQCHAITIVPLFDTHNVIQMQYMFFQCDAITTVPLFDTSSATTVDYMFQECTAVESGALALYNQMSTQATPPASYISCFRGCGEDTTTGAAELAQIPSDWK